MKYPLNLMIQRLSEARITVNDEAKERFNRYAELLVEWNEKMNLTAITEPEEIVIKHFLDCALMLKYVEIPKGARVIDVGTGAGFPGVVLKILRPDIDLTLLDGLNKRLIFLENLLNELSLSAKTVHMRAEEAGRKPEFRERYDLVTARAVARLNSLYEYCLPFCKKGGTFCSMKGPSAAEEIAEAKKAGTLLGGGEARLFEETLTGEEKRSFVTLKKISQTPPKYPRMSVKISKQPLI